MSARRKHISERQLWFLSLKKENAYPHIFRGYAAPAPGSTKPPCYAGYVEGRGYHVSSGGQESKCQVDVSQSNKELAKTKLENMDKTMQKLQHIGSLKDLRPQRDSVGVRSSVSGLKSECADNFSSEPDLWFALRDFVPEWNSLPGTRTGVNSRRADSRWHDILWWDHVNKYRTMRGNRSELARGRKSPRCHVNTPNVHQTSCETTREIWRSEGNQMIF